MPTSSQIKVLNTLRAGTFIGSKNGEISTSHCHDDHDGVSGADINSGAETQPLNYEVDQCLSSNSSKPMHTSMLRLTCDLNNFTSFTEKVEAPSTSFADEDTGSEGQNDFGQNGLTNIDETLHKLGFRDIAKKGVYGVRVIKRLAKQYK